MLCCSTFCCFSRGMNTAPDVISGKCHLPSIIIFDLDRTLWPFQVDKDTSNPFKKTADRTIVDSCGKVVTLFPGVLALLRRLEYKGFQLGVASRIEDVMGAYQLLHLFELSSSFAYKEIYPGSKTVHFQQIQRKTGFNYNSMMFFDDDIRNIRAVSRLGVVGHHIPEGGITSDIIEAALKEYSSAMS